MSPRAARRLWVEFSWLLRGQLYELRSQWFWYLIYLSFYPLTFLFFLWIYGASADPDAALYVVTGAVANGAVSGAMLSLGQGIARLRDQHALEYYASLPIAKFSFVAALATKGVLLSLPASLTILFVGTAALGLPLHVSPVFLILAYVVGSYSLAGVGAIIGFYSSTQNVGLITQIVGPLIVLFAPVYVPASRLPTLLQSTARFLPTTYVATCLRTAVTGAPAALFWPAFAVTLGWSCGGLVLGLAKANWRGARE